MTVSLSLYNIVHLQRLCCFVALGCYITKHGGPSRSSGYIRWETKATQLAHRDSNILLFSEEFVEIRNVSTGRLVQVIEGKDLRLLYSSQAGGSDTILVAMRGEKDDKDGVSDKVTELIETAELVRTPSTARVVPENLWDEWDM
jgi:RHO1 GDP-GTP exchange protein 1/2